MDTTFQQLAEEASAGLRSDRELFLEVSRGLYHRIEEQREELIGQGNDPVESAEMVRRALEPPEEVTAAYAVRLRRRVLARWIFLVVVVPIILPAVLYFAYGRATYLAEWVRRYRFQYSISKG